MGSKAAGKADTISLAGIFLTTVDSKSITMTPVPQEVGLFSYIVYTVPTEHVLLETRSPLHLLKVCV